MNPWTALLIGLLLGWLIEYAFDWFFWRRRSTDEKIVTDLQDQLQASEERSAELEAQLAKAKSDSEIWQSRSAELETEQVATAAKMEKVSNVDRDEFRGSLKGKLAAIGVGAAVGTAITAGEDAEEEEIGVIPDDELVEDMTGEQTDDEAASAEDDSSDEVLVDAEEESFTEISEMEEAEKTVESEEPVAAEAIMEDDVESGTEDSDETLAAGANLADEVETSEEVDSTDQDIEPEEAALDLDDSSDASETEMSDSDVETSLPGDGASTADENAFATREGGQES